MRAATVGLAFALSLPAIATAQEPLSYVNGAELLKDCTAATNRRNQVEVTDSSDPGWCDGLVYGVWNALGAFGIVCSPAEVKLSQVVLVVLKYLQDHPEQLHETQYRLVRKALVQVWPCKKP